MRKQSAYLEMAPLPGYVSNYVPCAGTCFSGDSGGYPRVALRRLESTYRTMCHAPDPGFRRLLEDIRELHFG
jgi:hypothetical protein